jgi:hypothetical protein
MVSSRAKNGFNYVSWLATAPQHRAWHYRQGQFDLPELARVPGQWLHEIKHDGFRIIARKSNGRVRLYSRPGNDFTRRFPLIVEALERLRSRSCIVDGEVIACDDNGVASFDLIRHHRANDRVLLYRRVLDIDCAFERQPWSVEQPDEQRDHQLPPTVQVALRGQLPQSSAKFFIARPL